MLYNIAVGLDSYTLSGDFLGVVWKLLLKYSCLQTCLIMVTGYTIIPAYPNQ